MLPRRFRSVVLGVIVALCASACRTHEGAPTGVAHVARRPIELVPRERPYDLEHVTLDIELDVERRALRASAALRLWAVRALRKVELDLDELEVESVHDRAGRSLAFEHARGRLSVMLAHELAAGDYEQLTVRYGGAPRRGLWFTGERDGVPTQVFSHNQCEDARAWFPCFDEPHERATSELRVTMPASWRAFAAGERIERVEVGDRARELWRMHVAHPSYLLTLAAGELTELAATPRAAGVRYASAPSKARHLERTLGETPRMLAYFEELLGARYPYAKYAQVCVDGFPYGGMENVSATTLTDTVLVDDEDALDLPATNLVAHEAAHQWFGDLVTCASWREAWLNEGFATYLASLYTQATRGEDEFQLELRELRDSWRARDVGDNLRPIVHGRARDPGELFFTGHVYQGAAVRLHHLRRVVGDVAFLRALREYVGAQRGRSVETSDFAAVVERVSARDLGWFFEQWFERPGHPHVTAHWRHDDARGVTTLELEQTQPEGTRVPAVFRLPLAIELRFESETRLEHVEFTRRRQRFEWTTTTRPTWVRVVDQSGPLFLQERRSVLEWSAIARACDDVVARRDAVAVLGRALRDARTPAERASLGDVLIERLRADPHDAVRAEAAAALATGVDAAARAALIESARVSLREEVGSASTSDGVLTSAVAPNETRATSLRENESELRDTRAGTRDVRTLLGSRSSTALAPLAFDSDASIPVPSDELVLARTRARHASRTCGASLEALRAWGVDAELAELALQAFERAPTRAARASAASLYAHAASRADASTWLRARILDADGDLLRARLLSVLAQLEQSGARDPLLACALDPLVADPARVLTIVELGARCRGDARVRAALIELLGSPRFHVRAAVLQALAGWTEPDVLRALERFAATSAHAVERRVAEDLLDRARSDA